MTPAKIRKKASFGLVILLSLLVPLIFVGCEMEAGVPGVPEPGTQTALEGELSKAESTIEALRKEIERTPETGEKSQQTTENTVGSEDKESGEAKADYESVKGSVQFDSPEWMALGKLAAKDVSGRAGFEGVFVNTPSSDGGTGGIVTGVAEVTYSTGAALPYVKGEQPPNVDIPKYSPALVRKLEKGDPGELIDIVLNLKDDLILTPLPRLNDSERGSDEWKKIDAVRQVEIDKIKIAREIQFVEFRELLRGKINFEIVYIPWIANTPTITVTLDSVPMLAELDQHVTTPAMVTNPRPNAFMAAPPQVCGARSGGVWSPPGRPNPGGPTQRGKVHRPKLRESPTAHGYTGPIVLPPWGRESPG